MSFFEALIYGMVQGLTEYLPISSSAHLILLPHFLGKADPGLAFDVFLHLGTLGATLGYFWRDWWELGRKLTHSDPLSRAQGRKFLWAMVLATLPALFVGALFHNWIEETLRGPGTIVWTLVIGGVVLYLVDRLRPQEARVPGVWEGLGIGLFQCLALIPGVSRSGSTITAARLLGISRVEAARFSFLISAPVTLAATVFEMRNWGELIHGTVGLGPLLVALLSSFLFGVLAIGFLMALVRKFSYLSFAIYRVALGFLVWFVLVRV